MIDHITGEYIPDFKSDHAPNGSTEHDHMCRCPGCESRNPEDYDGPLQEQEGRVNNADDPNRPPFKIGDFVEFNKLYGWKELKEGHRYGRVEGQHFYEQSGWVLQLQKMEMREGKMVYVGTAIRGVKLYMIPWFTVDLISLDKEPFPGYRA